MKEKKICPIEGCDNKVKRAGRCQKHYLNGEIKSKIRFCKVENCNSVFYSLDLCYSHYKRFKKFGDTTLQKLKQTCNDNFFAEETEESFYWAGFLAADGNIYKSKKYNSFMLSFHLQIRDEQHIVKFKNNINASHNFNYNQHKMGKGSVGISIYSEKLFNDLIDNFAFSERKSLTYCFPENLKTHPLIRHFIRGYFDGDGTISQSKNKKTYQLKTGFCIIGTQKCMQYFQEILINNVGVSLNSTIIKTVNIFRISYSKDQDIINIYNYLYTDATVFLDRKKERFEEIITNINNKIKYKGSLVKNSKLKEEQVTEIKKLLKLGNLTQRAIAKMFNINRVTIYDIKIGKSWAHIKID